MPHIANLMSEIIGSLYEIEDQVHKQEPHELCKKFIESGEQMHVLAALNIYMGMFEKLFEELLEYKADILKIFQFTMGHSDTEIALKGLQATCKLVYMLERKHSNYFVDALDYMIRVTMNAFDRGDEDSLEQCLIELKQVCDTEPKFFQSKFTELCENFQKIMAYKDYEKKTIRIMPVEFISTIVVRLKSAFAKKTKTIAKVVELIYGLMIDIDEDVDEEWLNPQDGCKIEEEEFSVNPAHVGGKCIDSLIRELGQELMMPIVQQVMSSNSV